MPGRRQVLLARVVARFSTVSFTTWPGAEKDAAPADPSAVEYFLVKVITSGTSGPAVAVEWDPRPLRLTFRQESAQTLFFSDRPPRPSRRSRFHGDLDRRPACAGGLRPGASRPAAGLW